MKIIASLTTIPSRINHIQLTLESILNQTIPINAIELNIPYICNRNQEEYEIPKWLIALEKNTKNTKCEVKIFRTEDYGAITKVAPTLIRYRDSGDVYVWSVDDDIEYPVNMLATLFREYTPHSKYVLSHSAGNWIYKENSLECISYSADREEGAHDFIEGFASVLYPAFLIENDFKKYVIETTEALDCRNSDDIIISNYLALKGIKIHNCTYPYSNNHILLNGRYLKYGFEKDALHKQQGGNLERYLRVFYWLRDYNLNGWIQNKKINL